jgi:hypothetical protein
MNTSFSAMNSSLSQKWNEINKKSTTKREGLQNMSNTMGNQFESKIGKGQPTMNMNMSSGNSQE